MSLLWTDVPLEWVFDGMYANTPQLKEITRDGITMLVAPQENGMGRIERIVSPNPRHYLRKDLSPGTMVPLQL